MSPQERFLTHAYVVLACALIEEYVEGCFHEHLIQALKGSQTAVADSFLFLATHFSSDIVLTP
jgi:hypothetical protein